MIPIIATTNLAMFITKLAACISRSKVNFFLCKTPYNQYSYSVVINRLYPKESPFSPMMAVKNDFWLHEKV